MAVSVDGDVLTGDWNPLIGCERYSAGCKNCWFLDFMFPWQQRLGNIPSTASLLMNQRYLESHDLELKVK